jgi:hypothetical protein
MGLFLCCQSFAQNAGEDPFAGNANAKGSSAGLSGIEGVWNAKARITVCATGATITSFDAMAIFAQDGTFHDTNATSPALRSPGFGRWVRLDSSNYYFVFKLFRFDAAGTYIGSTVVRHYVVSSPNSNSYTSSGTAQFFDANGNLSMTGCSAATATRMEL